MSADGLVKLNDMIDSWSTERLMIYGYSTQSYAMVSGTNAYTFGTGGTFTPRPIAIVAANIITDATLKLRYAMRLITIDEWNAIRDRQAGSLLPKVLYNDGQYPLSTLSMWPTPNSSTSLLELYTWQQIADFAALNSTFDLPIGYERAITYNLALDLAGEYRVSVPAEVLKVAIESKADLKALNAPPTHIPGMAQEQMAQAQVGEASQPNAGAPPPPPGSMQGSVT
jgi:hypothetical protein